MKKTKMSPKQVIRNRTRLEWVLLAALALIAFLWLASRYQWWPWNTQKSDLGTAFYVIKQTPKSASEISSNGSGDSTNTSGGSGSGNNGSSSGNNGTGGNSGGTSTKSPLLSFAAGVDTGNTKQQESAQASGLNENCALLVNSSTAGKQEVCTYTEGDKVVTVTYLNDHVVSASRSGF